MTTDVGNPAVVPAIQLHHRLVIALDYAGLKPHHMAEYLDKHRNTIGSYLHGQRIPDRSTLRDWALRCGVPFDWLAYGVDYHPKDGTTARYSRITTPLDVAA